MGLISNILFFPVTGPVAGIKWALGKVQTVVEEELTDDTSGSGTSMTPSTCGEKRC